MGEPQIVDIPVISSHVIHGLPAFVRNEFGEKALAKANRAAGFDADLIEERNFFIPQHALLNFVRSIERAAGMDHFGLVLAPMMDIATYGSFGRYVLDAATLCEAMERAISALPFHSTYDRLATVTCGDEIHFSYRFALAGSPGYDVVAVAAAAELLSVFKTYLPMKWRPLRVELDVGKPARTTLFEDIFQCPVFFDAPAVCVVAERHQLGAATKRTSQNIVSLADVARDRANGAPTSLLHVTMEGIRTRLLTGDILIDEIARSMDLSVRTLQRELHRSGTDFRSLTNSIRTQRAIELLEYTYLPITMISEDLGYSSPAGFTRAFRNAIGCGPREYRDKRRG